MVLAPLVLIHLRELKDFESLSLEEVSADIFVTFTNLVMGSGESNFLRHLVHDDANAMEWRMDFFDKLLEKVCPAI